MKAKREPMSSEEATSFQHFSVWNAASAIRTLQESGACTNGCEPYRDIYTYNRWQAQGYQVRKGEHGAKLSILIERDEEADDGQTKHISQNWHTTVFCRCQVDQKESR